MTAEHDGHGRVGNLGPPADRVFDHAKVAHGVRLILEGIGEDLERDGLRETPVRVARMYEEVTSGLHEDPARILDAVFDEGHDEMVMIRDIPMASAIWAVSRSWTWSRRASPSTSRASLDSPVIRPCSLGM